MPFGEPMTTAPQSDWVSLTWTIDKENDVTTVSFFGEIDENADLSPLGRILEGKVVFHLENIRRINSCGVREWVNFIRELPAISELIFIHCSPATVTQLNMIYNFRGAAHIKSIYAPYICEYCDIEEEKLIDIDSQFPDKDGKISARLPEYNCPKCNEPMEFDDLPDRYLSFLVDV